MKKIHSISTLLLCLCAVAAEATEVNVVALFNDKAMVSIDGGRQQMLKLGQTTAEGVKLISSDSQQAVLEIDGKRRTLGMGQSLGYAASASGGGGGSSGGNSVVLTADVRGHFITRGSINGFPTRFMVDTGASFVSMDVGEARRIGIDYKRGERGVMNTANGQMVAYKVRLDNVKVGDISLNFIDATVSEASMGGMTLLGMSFLNRVEMNRADGKMTLTRKY
jgi:aspartyl protease family protein